MGKWNFESIKEATVGFEFLSEFIAYARPAYQASLKSGRHAEITSDLKRFTGEEKRAVYIILCLKTNRVYVGLTTWEDVDERRHVREPMASMRKTGVIRRITPLLEPIEAMAQEKGYIAAFRRAHTENAGAFICVNKDDGGGLGRVVSKTYLCRDGETRTVRECQDHSGTPFGTIRARIYAGDTIDEAMRTVRDPLLIRYGGQSETVRMWSEITGINASTIRARLKAGKCIEDVFFNDKRRFFDAL